MKLTNDQLKKIIKEELKNVLEGPRISGVMNPEDPSVMVDIERRRNQGDEERVAETFADAISALAGLIDWMALDEPDREATFEILSGDPRYPMTNVSTEEVDIMWALAQQEAAEM